MLRSFTIGLSACALGVSSFPVAATANSVSPLQRWSQQLSQAERIPEVIVDTVPDNDPVSSEPIAQEDVIIDTEPDQTNPTPSNENSDRRFTCERNNGEYTVVYRPQSEPNTPYAWAIPEEMGSDWSPQRRCQTISDRLERYRPDGLMELQTTRMNGEDVVCVTTEADNSCRIVFTVPRGQDPLTTRDRVFENLADAHEGRRTQGVRTFTDNSSLGDLLRGGSSQSRQTSENINLRPFLDEADGGTGQELRSNDSSPSNLDPDLFR